ncbi:MAG: hypothetical protein QOI48_3630 [Solirubrobacteraceae bacterium]|jgi:hypothetical protein|nr:hypothetical protein [Solirubrobacteraceae bacterium]
MVLRSPVAGDVGIACPIVIRLADTSRESAHGGVATPRLLAVGDLLISENGRFRDV